MNIEFSVDSGEVKASRGAVVLRAGAIGSCVVVTAFDQDAGVGGMAHVMLAGASRDPDPSVKTKYANDAIQELTRKMSALGACEERLLVCLVGGGNVLGPGYNSPGPEVVISLTDIFGKMNIQTMKTEVGGDQRRSCALDVSTGQVTYTVGDSGSLMLWKPGGE